MRLQPALFLVSTLFAGQATAQQPAPEGEEVVVTGSRNTAREVRDFVSALTPTSPRGQLGKFEGRVCPAAFGVGPSQKALIERRLRAVAARAGIEVAKPDCDANAILIVTGAKAAFLHELRRRQPTYFGALTPRQYRQLARAPGPTASWQLEYKVDARGVPQPTDGVEPHFNRTTFSPSRITAPDRPVFEAAALVVEQAALDGLTTTQLADYAAMRLFARTEPQRLAGSSAPTILGVLDAPIGTAVPLTLTEWDMGFLRGLYGSADNLYAASQRSHIARRIAQDLADRRDEAEPAGAPTEPGPPR